MEVKKMALFESKKDKVIRKLAENLVNSRKEGYFTCYYCNRPQKITYYGNDDTWTCPRCKTKNRCG